MEHDHWSKQARTFRYHAITPTLLFLFLLASPIFASMEFPTKSAVGAKGRETASRSAEALEAAAQRNEELRNRLRWSFGGRLQKGWTLYLPLIQQLIGSNAGPASPAFAEAIAQWQEETGLPASGQLEERTWAAMVSTFQARRPGHGRNSGGRRRGAKSDLVLAPPKDFYDPSRSASLRYINREAYDAYLRMYEAAREALGAETLSTHGLKIVSAYRSPSYQAALRRRSPRAGRATLAVNSPHFTGCALDLFVGGDPVSSADWNRHRQVETPLYLWMVRHASQFGFVPYFYEPWHWEYRGDPTEPLPTSEAGTAGAESH